MVFFKDNLGQGSSRSQLGAKFTICLLSQDNYLKFLLKTWPIIYHIKDIDFVTNRTRSWCYEYFMYLKFRIGQDSTRIGPHPTKCLVIFVSIFILFHDDVLREHNYFISCINLCPWLLFLLQLSDSPRSVYKRVSIIYLHQNLLSHFENSLIYKPPSRTFLN